MAKLNRTKVKNAISGCYGVLATVAKACGVTRAAVVKFLKKDKNKDLMELVNEDKERILDVAENQLFKNVAVGDKKSIEFLLKTKGKGRGYVEKKEIISDNKTTTKIDLSEFEAYNKEESLKI